MYTMGREMWNLTMVYIDSAPYFCMATETVTDLANKAISQREQSVDHSLELAAEARASYNSGAPKTEVDASLENLPA